jgi:hypothetical protein
MDRWAGGWWIDDEGLGGEGEITYLPVVAYLYLSPFQSMHNIKIKPNGKHTLPSK